MSQSERELVVVEARKWLRTPYVSNADVIGAGVDCGMLLVRVFVDAGLVEPFDPRPYPAQWALNQRAEIYLGIVERCAKEITEPPLPGDVALFKFGHCWAHGSIVVDWPTIIHANPPGECRYDNAQTNTVLLSRPRRFFSVWAK